VGIEMAKKPTSNIEKYIFGDPVVRKKLARQSHYLFFHIYFSSHISYKTASFQKQMLNIAQDDSIRTAVITAFRGSGKSTIMSLSYPIWAMIGLQQKKHILIISQTQTLCREMLDNIRDELETNSLLVNDFGPFRDKTCRWSSSALLVSSYGSRIAAVSCEESIRGIRHREYRPDLLIIDDIEDLNSVKTKEGRDKIFNKLTRDIFPTGDTGTKKIIVGNKLHEDGLMMRLKRTIKEDTVDKIYREYPLLDDKGKCLWQDKFRTEKEIVDLKNDIFSESAWLREYLLKVVSEDDAVIRQEWVNYYEDLPVDLEPRYIMIAIDPAISKEKWASHTAMVSAMVFGYAKDLKVYILPNPVDEKLDFPEAVKRAKALADSFRGSYIIKLTIEEVGYQKSLAQTLLTEGYNAEGFKLHGQDKRQRLSVSAPFLQNGNILFPKKGCENLIHQLICFGYGDRNDLADAFSMLVLKITQDSKKPFKIHRVHNPFDYGVQF
jgi:predicted phage terminase large subunit-like protein